MSGQTQRQLTPDEIRAQARAWYDRQLAILEKVHGSWWPAHREWIEEYLCEEVRERLFALGWRPKK